MADGVLTFTANTSQVVESLNNIGRNVERIQQRSLTLAGVFKGAFGLIGIQSAINFFNNMRNEIDASKKAAEDLGMTFRRYQQLKMTASLEGIGNIEDVLAKIQRYQAGLKGIGIAGITPYQTPYEALMRLAGASRYEQIGVLGRTAGTHDIGRLQNLQTVFSSVTDEAARTIEEFNDSLELFVTSLKAFFAQYLTPVINALRRGVDIFTDMGPVRSGALLGTGAAVMYALSRAAGNILGGVSTYFNLQKGYKALPERFYDILDSMWSGDIFAELSAIEFKGATVYSEKRIRDEIGALTSLASNLTARPQRHNVFDSVMRASVDELEKLNMIDNMFGGIENAVDIENLSANTFLIFKAIKDRLIDKEERFFTINIEEFDGAANRLAASFGATGFRGISKFAALVADIVAGKRVDPGGVVVDADVAFEKLVDLNQFLKSYFTSLSATLQKSAVFRLGPPVLLAGLAFTALYKNRQIIESELGWIIEGVSGFLGALAKSVTQPIREMLTYATDAVFRVGGVVLGSVYKYVNSFIQMIAGIDLSIFFVEAAALTVSIFSVDLANKIRATFGHYKYIATIKINEGIEKIRDRMRVLTEGIDNIFSAWDRIDSGVRLPDLQRRLVSPQEKIDLNLQQIDELNETYQQIVREIAYNEAQMGELNERLRTTQVGESLSRQVTAVIDEYEQSNKNLQARQNVISDRIQNLTKENNEISENYNDYLAQFIEQTYNISEYVKDYVSEFEKLVDTSMIINARWRSRLIDNRQYNEAMEKLNDKFAETAGYGDIWQAIKDYSKGGDEYLKSIENIKRAFIKVHEGVLEESSAIKYINQQIDALFGKRGSQMTEPLQQLKYLNYVGQYVDTQDVRASIIKAIVGVDELHNIIESFSEIQRALSENTITQTEFDAIAKGLRQKVVSMLGLDSGETEQAQKITRMADAAFNAGLISIDQYWQAVKRSLGERQREIAEPIVGAGSVYGALAKSINGNLQHQQIVEAELANISAFINEARMNGLLVR